MPGTAVDYRRKVSAVPRTPSVPRYRLHQPSGQAVVTVRLTDGSRRDVYLGKYNSEESRQKYARIIAELAAAPTPARVTVRATSDVTVNEVLLAFWEHAQRHYRRADGTPTNEVKEYRLVSKAVRELYGHTPATEFGPLALKAVRNAMLAAGLARTYINQRVGKVRRIFKWAAGEQLIPFGVYQSLTAVAGLQKGRTNAREPEPVGPVAEEHVRAVLPFVRPQVRGMVEVQLLTGMRPDEVCQLRPCSIDMAGEVWVYRPLHHKNAHRDKPRSVPIGPRAQAILKEFAPGDLSGYYFSPRRVVEQLHAERTKVRKTPRYPSHLRRNAGKRVLTPKRAAGERYTSHSYSVAVTRACRKAGVPDWSPNQLRHSHGTVVRHRFGLEAAQVALGHQRADVTQVYAEKNLALAAKVAAEIG